MTEVLVPHQDLPISPERRPEQGQYCLFLSGGMATNREMVRTTRVLEEVYGQGRVDVYGSALSTDPTDQHRFRKMAACIHNGLRAGNHVTIIAHSLGATEAHLALKETEERYPGLLDIDEYKKNLEVTLIAPFGFHKDFKEKWQQVKGLGRFITSQAMGNGQLKGIDLLAAYPLGNMDQAEVTQKLRTTLPHLSQHHEDISIGKLDTTKDYRQYLNDAERDALADNDHVFRDALQRGSQKDSEQALKERAKLLSSHHQNIFSGYYTGDRDNPYNTNAPDTRPFTIAALLGTLSQLGKMAKNMDKPFKTMQNLHQRGININFIVPEYDVVLPYDLARDFFGSSEKNPIALMEQATHTTLSIQPGTLVNALRALKAA